MTIVPSPSKIKASSHIEKNLSRRPKFEPPIESTTNLINALPGVVGVHVLVLGAEVSPLEAVNGSEVTFLAIAEAEGVEERAGGVPVPDADILGLKKTTADSVKNRALAFSGRPNLIQSIIV